MKKLLKYTWIPFVGVFVLYFLFWVLTCWLFDNFQDRANFGDMFGAVNALFTGLAFAGVIITILQQKEELSLQRKEMQDSRHELKGQKEQLEKQAFQNDYFRLLEYTNNYISLLKYNNTVGNDAIRHLFDEFRRKYHEGRGGPQDLQFLRNIYHNFYLGFKHHYLPYIDNILFSLELINNSAIKNPIIYANILKSQIPAKAIALVFYHVICGYANEYQMDLIKKYDLFSNISLDDLIVKEHLNFGSPFSQSEDNENV